MANQFDPQALLSLLNAILHDEPQIQSNWPAVTEPTECPKQKGSDTDALTPRRRLTQAD